MDEEAFRSFLRRARRSASAIDRCVAGVGDFERWLATQGCDTLVADDVPHLLAGFVSAVEERSDGSAKGYLWALAHYYDFAAEVELRELCRELRRQRIDRTAVTLATFERATEAVERLAGIGIRTTDQLLTAAGSVEARAALAARIGVPPGAVTELVKLSDLARIPGIKATRARLYHDAGVDTVERLARWDPEALQTHVASFVAESGFPGIAPLPKEVAFTVATARRLPRVVTN